MKMFNEADIKKLKGQSKRDLKKKIKQAKQKGIVDKNLSEEYVDKILKHLITIYVNHINFNNYSSKELLNFVYPNLLKIHICKFSKSINDFDIDEKISYIHQLFNNMFENKSKYIEYELKLMENMEHDEGVHAIDNYNFKKKVRHFDNVLYKMDMNNTDAYDLNYDSDNPLFVSKVMKILNKTFNVNEDTIDTVVKYIFKMFWYTHIEELVEKGHEQFVSNVCINTLKISAIIHYFYLLEKGIIETVDFVNEFFYMIKNSDEIEFTSRNLLELNDLNPVEIDVYTLEVKREKEYVNE